MYQRHADFDEPTNPDVPIWRFVDIERLINLLSSSSLYFARADQMSDPYEGVFPRGNMTDASLAATYGPGATREHINLVRRAWEYSNRSLRYEAFLSCWHMNEHQSEAMWKLYATRGVAIRSTYARLLSVAKENGEHSILIGEVAYLDYERQGINGATPLRTLVTKRKSFEHERELRAVIVKNIENYDDTAGCPDTQPTGISAQIDLRTLVETLYVFPGAKHWVIEVVKSVVAQYRYGDIPVIPSTLLDAPGAR